MDPFPLGGGAGTGADGGSGMVVRPEKWWK